MKLIDEWKSAHKMLSVQLLALNGAVHAGWAQLDDSIKSLIPHRLAVGVAIVLFLLPLVARLIDQGIAAETKDPK